MSGLKSAWLNWSKTPPAARTLIVLAFIAAPALGVLAMTMGLLSQSKPAFIAILPTILLLGFSLILERRGLLLFLLIVRGGLDPFLEATRVPLGSASMGLGGVLNGLLIVLAIIEARRQNNDDLPRMLKKGVPLALVLLFALMRSPAPAEATKLLLNIVTYACMFSLGVVLAREKGLDYVLKVVLYASIPAISLSLVMYVTGWQVGAGAANLGEWIESRGRFQGSFAHPNIMAFFLTNTVIVCLYLFPKIESKAQRLGIYITLALALTLIILTKTRAAWIALAMIFALYGVLFNRKLLAPMIILGAITSLIPEVQERLLSLKDDRPYLIYSTLNSYAWRKAIWADALAYMNASTWLIGAGLQGFFVDSVKFFHLSGGNPFGAHNVYVQLLYDTGIFGLTLWVALLLSLIIPILKAWNKDRATAFAGLCFWVVYVTVGYSDNILGYLVYNIYFWIAIGAITHDVMNAPPKRNRDTNL